MVIGFIACWLACTIGYIVGRCFRDLEGIAVVQDLQSLETENTCLRNVIERMQEDLELMLDKSRWDYRNANEE
jgi:hypothetical protein